LLEVRQPWLYNLFGSYFLLLLCVQCRLYEFLSVPRFLLLGENDVVLIDLAQVANFLFGDVDFAFSNWEVRQKALLFAFRHPFHRVWNVVLNPTPRLRQRAVLHRVHAHLVSRQTLKHRLRDFRLEIIRKNRAALLKNS
jgi:hypothetical protein